MKPKILKQKKLNKLPKSMADKFVIFMTDLVTGEMIFNSKEDKAKIEKWIKS